MAGRGSFIESFPLFGFDLGQYEELFTEKLEVVEWEPPTRLLMAHRSFIHGTGEWSFRAVDGGTLFRWSEDISLPVPLLGEIALQVYRPFMRYLMRGALEGLRAFVARGAA